MVSVLTQQTLEVGQVLLSLKVCDWVFDLLFSHVVGQIVEKIFSELYLRKSDLCSVYTWSGHCLGGAGAITPWSTMICPFYLAVLTLNLEL